MPWLSDQMRGAEGDQAPVVSVLGHGMVNTACSVANSGYSPNAACGMWFKTQEESMDHAAGPAILADNAAEQNGNGPESSTRADTPSDFYRVRMILPLLDYHPGYDYPNRINAVPSPDYDQPKTIPIVVRMNWRCCVCRAANFSMLENFCPWCSHPQCEGCSLSRRSGPLGP